MQPAAFHVPPKSPYASLQDCDIKTLLNITGWSPVIKLSDLSKKCIQSWEHSAVLSSFPLSRATCGWWSPSVGSLPSVWGSNVVSRPPLLLHLWDVAGPPPNWQDSQEAITDTLEDVLSHEQAASCTPGSTESTGYSDHNVLICTSKVSSPALQASCTAEFATVPSQGWIMFLASWWCFWQALRESFVPQQRFISSLRKWCWSRAEEGAGVRESQTLGQCSPEELCTGVHWLRFIKKLFSKWWFKHDFFLEIPEVLFFIPQQTEVIPSLHLVSVITAIISSLQRSETSHRLSSKSCYWEWLLGLG